MPDKERRAERTEQEDIAGVHRGLRRKESGDKAKKYAVRKAGEKWAVYTVSSGKVAYTTGTEEAAYKKRDELIGRSDSLWGKVKKFFKKGE